METEDVAGTLMQPNIEKLLLNVKRIIWPQHSYKYRFPYTLRQLTVFVDFVLFVSQFNKSFRSGNKGQEG